MFSSLHHFIFIIVRKTTTIASTQDSQGKEARFTVWPQKEQSVFGEEIPFSIGRRVKFVSFFEHSPFIIVSEYQRIFNDNNRYAATWGLIATHICSVSGNKSETFTYTLSGAVGVEVCIGSLGKVFGSLLTVSFKKALEAFIYFRKNIIRVWVFLKRLGIRFPSDVLRCQQRSYVPWAGGFIRQSKEYIERGYGCEA